MTSRPYRESDRAALEAMAATAGFPIPNLSSPMIEGIQVIVDENDSPVMAVIGERICQVFVISRLLSPSPAQKLHAIRLLHESLPVLAAKGYSTVEGFIHPKLAPKFGRRLERTFGWVKNWPSWSKRLF